jgi:hypothetical protein
METVGWRDYITKTFGDPRSIERSRVAGGGHTRRRGDAGALGLAGCAAIHGASIAGV